MSKKADYYAKRFRKWRGCDLKAPYATEELARAVVAAMAFRQRGDPGVDVYECSFCKCWHVGHDNLRDDD